MSVLKRNPHSRDISVNQKKIKKKQEFFNQNVILKQEDFMIYHTDEVIQFIKEEDVKFIRLAFFDVLGTQKNISIMPYEIERAFSEGIPFDASSILGFGGEEHSDLFLHPDPSTITILPWRPEHGKVVRMYCKISYPNGDPFPLDTRSILIKAIGEAKKQGLNFYFGAEKEFYLFKLNDDGTPSKIPYDNAGYMDIAPLDKGENVRREICLDLEQMGIRPESSHHEEGPGQNEIDFRYSDALKSADNVETFTSVVKTVAAKNGLWASFEPKPLENQAGSGLHINISVKSDEIDESSVKSSEKSAENLESSSKSAKNQENLLESEKNKTETELLRQVIAGILNRIQELTAIFNPSPESYNRLGKFKAPKYISWSKQNRSQLIRIPAANGEYVRAELRSPDSSSNIYLVYASLIYAGLEGIKNKMQLSPSLDLNLLDENVLSKNQEIISKLKTLPLTFDDAWEKSLSSDFVKQFIPKEILSFCKNYFYLQIEKSKLGEKNFDAVNDILLKRGI